MILIDDSCLTVTVRFGIVSKLMPSNVLHQLTSIVHHVFLFNGRYEIPSVKVGR